MIDASVLWNTGYDLPEHGRLRSSICTCACTQGYMLSGIEPINLKVTLALQTAGFNW
jgi:hypothetical protein